MQLVHLRVIHLGDGGVHLHANAIFVHVANACKRFLKRAIFSTKRILTCFVRKIKRHGNTRNIVLVNFSSNLVGNHGAVGADNRMQAFFVRVVDNIPDVSAHQRLAAR